MSTKSFISNSPGETSAIARELAVQLIAGDFVALTGELGAGKTEFVRGVVAARGVAAPVSSPSFVRLHSYGGEPPIYHADFYLAKSEDDAADYGVEELLDDGGIVLAEWAELFPGLIPPYAWRIRIEICAGEDERLVIIEH